MGKEGLNVRGGYDVLGVGLVGGRGWKVWVIGISRRIYERGGGDMYGGWEWVRGFGWMLWVIV